MGSSSLKLNRPNQSEGTELQHNQFTGGLNGGLNYTTSPTRMFTWVLFILRAGWSCEATASKLCPAAGNNLRVHASLNLSVHAGDTAEEKGSRREPSTFNYAEHPCGVITACCCNNQQSLLSLPTMKRADAAASSPSPSLCPQSLS